jgi:hypothetical protein
MKISYVGVCYWLIWPHQLLQVQVECIETPSKKEMMAAQYANDYLYLLSFYYQQSI